MKAAVLDAGLVSDPAALFGVWARATPHPLGRGLQRERLVATLGGKGHPKASPQHFADRRLLAAVGDQGDRQTLLLVCRVALDLDPAPVGPVAERVEDGVLVSASQHEPQSAIYVFDPEIDLELPLVVRYGARESNDWMRILDRLRDERAKVRARSGAGLTPVSRTP